MPINLPQTHHTGWRLPWLSCEFRYIELLHCSETNVTSRKCFLALFRCLISSPAVPFLLSIWHIQVPDQA